MMQSIAYKGVKHDKTAYPYRSTGTNLVVFQWADYNHIPLMFAIPNGGSRHPIEAKHLKEQGVKAGVPDIFLPMPRGEYHGMFIEMKRLKGGRLSPEQTQWLHDLSEQGYAATVCKGWEVAAEFIKRYLEE